MLGQPYIHQRHTVFEIVEFDIATDTGFCVGVIVGRGISWCPADQIAQCLLIFCGQAGDRSLNSQVVDLVLFFQVDRIHRTL